MVLRVVSALSQAADREKQDMTNLEEVSKAQRFRVVVRERSAAQPHSLDIASHGLVLGVQATLQEDGLGMLSWWANQAPS